MPATDQGATKDRYRVIPRTLIFLTRGDTVLLLKGSPHKRLWADQYNGLGGHIEPGESVMAAAYRELQEEAGVSSCQLTLCGIVTIDSRPETGIILFVFRGAYPEGVVQPSLEGTLAWVPISLITALPLVEDLPTLLPRVLAYSPGDPPFSAHYRYDEADNLIISFWDEK